MDFVQGRSSDQTRIINPVTKSSTRLGKRGGTEPEPESNLFITGESVPAETLIQNKWNKIASSGPLGHSSAHVLTKERRYTRVLRSASHRDNTRTTTSPWKRASTPVELVLEAQVQTVHTFEMFLCWKTHKNIPTTQCFVENQSESSRATPEPRSEQKRYYCDP